MNNFSSMASVMAGLNSAPILRLKRTLDLLSQKTKTQKTDLDKLMDSTKNFLYYKQMLRTINPPVVPFLGEYEGRECSSRVSGVGEVADMQDFGYLL